MVVKGADCMENHLYSHSLSKDMLGEESQKLGYLKCFLNEDKEVDRLIINNFPISYFGNPDDLLRVRGSKKLIATFEKLDADKDDFIETLNNIEYIGLSHQNELIFNFPNQEVKAASIYSFKSEFLSDFCIEKYVSFCDKNDCADLIKENLDSLFKRFASKEKQYRLLRDREKEWRLRGFTSDKYNNYDNNIALYLALLAVHKYASENDIYYYINQAYLSDSAIYILFEQDKPVYIEKVGEVYLGIAVSNGEIRNRTFRFDTRYRVVDPEKGQEFAAILNNSIFSIVHNMGISKVEGYLKNIVNIKDHEQSIINFITKLKCTEPLSSDAVYMLLDDLTKRIAECSDISKKTKDAFKQSEIRNIVNNTLTLIDFLDKANSIVTDIDERIFVERIFHQIMARYTDKKESDKEAV